MTERSFAENVVSKKEILKTPLQIVPLKWNVSVRELAPTASILVPPATLLVQ